MTDTVISYSHQMPGRSNCGRQTNLRMKDGTTYNGTIVAGERNGVPA